MNGVPYVSDPAVQPPGTITATPARTLRRNAIKVLRVRGVKAGRRRR